MDLIKELLIVAGRIITILPLMLFVVIYMGKRSIGELPVFDFLVIITLGSVVGADIAEPAIPHIHTAVAIVLIGLLQRIVSGAIIKYRKLGHLITFDPTIVIQDGKLIVKNLQKLRYSIDNILQMLREKDVFDINDVHLGIIESNGNMSVLKKPIKSEVTIEDLKINKASASISYPVIIEGIINKIVLSKLNLTDEWLNQQLTNLGIKDIAEVFYASITSTKILHVSLKNYMEDQTQLPPIYN